MTVEIRIEEYKALIEDQTKLELIKEYLEKANYVSIDILKALVGYKEVEKDDAV